MSRERFTDLSIKSKVHRHQQPLAINSFNLCYCHLPCFLPSTAWPSLSWATALISDCVNPDSAHAATVMPCPFAIFCCFCCRCSTSKVLSFKRRSWSGLGLETIPTCQKVCVRSDFAYVVQPCTLSGSTGLIVIDVAEHCILRLSFVYGAIHLLLAWPSASAPCCLK